MMKCDINKVIISGCVVSEPRMNFTAMGTAVMNFTLESAGSRYKEFTEIVVWGELAEKLSTSIKTNDRVMVEGALHRRAKKNGEWGILEVNASRIYSMEDEPIDIF